MPPLLDYAATDQSKPKTNCPANAQGTPMPIVNRVADLHNEIKEWRRDFHAYPELRFDVHRTAGAVAEKLKSFGCDEVVPGIGRTGVVGVIRGRKAGNKVRSEERRVGKAGGREGRRCGGQHM